VIAQSNMRPLIQRQQPFKSGNVYAEVHHGLYAVFSYGPHFPMAVKSEQGWLINKDRYSPSTTIQQSKTGVRLLPGARSASTEELCAILQEGTPAYQRAVVLAHVTSRMAKQIVQPEIFL
jgi:hypothetical protein